MDDYLKRKFENCSSRMVFPQKLVELVVGSPLKRSHKSFGNYINKFVKLVSKRFTLPNFLSMLIIIHFINGTKLEKLQFK